VSAKEDVPNIMTILQADIFGSPNIGVYCFACEGWAAVPAGTPQNKKKKFSDCLHVEVCEVNVAGSNLLGILLAGNTNGLAVPDIINNHELETIKKSTKSNIETLKDERNALGNLILANDHGAIVDPSFSTTTIRALEQLFQVEVVKGHISGFPYVGSLGVATNKGAIIHPLIRDDEKETLEEVLKVPIEPSTVNGGVPFIRSGLLATSLGVVTGPLTVGNELMVISRMMEV
jgi:translation initiation factor 6